MVDWITLKDLAVPLHGVAFDVFDYFYKVIPAEINLAKLKWRDNKNKVWNQVDQRILQDEGFKQKVRDVIRPYDEDLFAKYDGKVKFFTNMYGPSADKFDQIAKLHKKTKMATYLDWLDLGLDCGTLEDKKYILNNTSKIANVHLFPLGSDKFENIAKMLKRTPPQYKIIGLKDVYSTFEPEHFETLLKVIDDHYETGAGATGVKIKINTDINWINTVSLSGKFLAEYQEMMYSMAMYQRNGLDSVNFVSGAFSIWDRDNLEEIIDKHSLTRRWKGEDYELSVRSFCNGRSVRFDDRMPVTTQNSPSDWNRFLKVQQRGWVEALITETNDLLFEPIKYVAKEGFKSLTFQKKNNKEYKSRFNPVKVLRNAQMMYQFYGMNYINQCCLYFPKMLGSAIIGTSMLNNIDWMFKTNIFPESLMGISTHQQTSLYYMGALSALAGYHLIRSDLPNKKKRIASTLTYPFFMFTHQITSYFPGGFNYLKNFARRNIFKKKDQNRIEEFLNAHTLVYPQSILNPGKYEQNLADKNFSQNNNENVNRMFDGSLEDDVLELARPLLEGSKFFKTNGWKKKKDVLKKNLKGVKAFTNYFYETDYEIELMLALVDKNYVSEMKLKPNTDMQNPFGEHELYGILNLAGKELGLYNMKDYTQNLNQLLSKTDIDFNGQPRFKQSGFIIPVNGKENICLYHIQEFSQDDSELDKKVASEIYCSKYVYDKNLGSYKLMHKPHPKIISQGFEKDSYDSLYDLESLTLILNEDEEQGQVEKEPVMQKNNDFKSKIRKILKLESNPLQYSSIALEYKEEDIAVYDDIVLFEKGYEPYL